MAPAWEPQRSTAGSQAAILAAGSAQKTHHRQSSSPNLMGNTAANAAFQGEQAHHFQPEHAGYITGWLDRGRQRGHGQRRTPALRVNAAGSKRVVPRSAQTPPPMH